MIQVYRDRYICIRCLVYRRSVPGSCHLEICHYDGAHLINEKYVIRSIRASEIPLLRDFLYEAIFVPSGVTPPERNIIDQPELQVYIEAFGKRPDDHCLVAIVDGKIAGAVWARVMDDYGHIDDETPSLAISLYPEYRGRGIGTELMRQMLSLLRKAGYAKASLSVQKANYAVKMYRSLGFEVVEDTPEEYIMIIRL